MSAAVPLLLNQHTRLTKEHYKILLQLGGMGH
jgi:hypothetical protein